MEASDPVLPEFAHAGWGTLMAPHMALLESVWLSVAQLSDIESLTPVRAKVFAAMSMEPTDVKVVILGQDPYPGPGLATGRAFEVPRGVKFPPTLRNIAEEYRVDVGKEFDIESMQQWVQQGVLLLNRVLTTHVGRSLAHASAGWVGYTDMLLTELTRVNPTVVAVLWGAKAQSASSHFAVGNVIAGPHPSPLSAYRGFFGSRPFSRVNARLSEIGRAPIQW